MMPTKEIKLLPHQFKFLNSQKLHTGIISGFGAGKTFAGVLKTIHKMCEYRVNVLYLLPSYKLIEDPGYDYFMKNLELVNIPYKLRKHSARISTPYSDIIFRSMDNEDKLVGFQVGYTCIDEADKIDTERMKRVFVAALARTRLKSNVKPMLNQVDFVSTPEGFKFLYDFFVVNDGPDREIIKSTTFDNPNLPKSYVDGLTKNLTPNQIKALVYGTFINLNTGLVYPYFDREKHHQEISIGNYEQLKIGF